MKKIIVAILVVIAGAGLAIFAAVSAEQRSNDYIRIHIRANSNDHADQQVKLVVRDKIIEYLTPLLAQSQTREGAYRAIEDAQGDLADLATATLKSYGFAYTAKTKLTKERFPARQYGDFVLDAGIYDALIVELGTAEGDNWWCIAYPPLCFIPAENSAQVMYKSKILEIIEKYLG